MSNASEAVPLGTTMPLENTGSGELSANVEMVSRDRYALGGEIAQGGIGRVFQASDRRLERHVALKQLLDPSPEHEARFLREALVTARLQHPAIVPVYDVGRFPDGEIFYAMKLVTGRSLGDIVQESDSFDKRLALLPHVIAVAEAIAYAHSERIVHRDLKPANVLIGPFGETVVIDWGIAKDLREQEELKAKQTSTEEMGTFGDASTSLTMAGSVLGTPGYMPPEQAEGSPVDERADVYALGAILYYVLAGIAPYDGKSGFEVLTRVLTEAPPDLSTRERRVPGDLLAIVRKAMARDAQERYPTANEFAHDLRRFQTGQIVGAYHYSRRERAYRFAQKHRGVLATTALGLLLVGVIGFTSLARVLDARQVAEVERDRANDERARAEAKQAEAEAASRKALQQKDELLLMEARNYARRDPNAAVGWLATLSGSFQRWGEARLIATDAFEYGFARVLRGHRGPISMIQYSPDGTKIITASDDRNVGLWSGEGRLVRMLEGHTDEVWRVKFSRNGKHFVSSSKDGTARIWDSETGDTVSIFRAAGPEVAWAEFLEDEKSLAIINCASKHVELHNGETGTIETLPGDTTCPGSFDISNDRRTLYYVADGRARVLDLKTRNYRDYDSPDGWCSSVYASIDGRHIACGGNGGFSALWDVASGRQVESIKVPEMIIHGFAQFSPTANEYLRTEGTVLQRRDLKTGEIRRMSEHQGSIFTALYSRNGRYIATGSFDNTLSLMDTTNGTVVRRYGFRDTVSWTDFSPDLRNIAVSSWDSNARIFPLVPSRNRVVAKGSAAMKMALFSNDQQAIVALEDNGTVHVNALAEQTPRQPPTMLDGSLHALSPDATRIAYVNAKGQLLVHFIDHLTPDQRFDGHTGAIEAIRFSPRGTHMLTIGRDKTARFWDLTAGQPPLVIPSIDENTSIAISLDNSYVALGNRKGMIRVITTATGAEKLFSSHVNKVTALTFLSDGKRLISGGSDHTLRVWDLAEGLERVIDASGLGITKILSSKDGQTIYSLGLESSIRRWNLKTGDQLPILRGHRSLVVNIALSPEESRLVSTGSNGDIRVWDLPTGQSRMLEGHRDKVRWILFSPRGDKFITAGNDGSVRIWHDDLPFDGAALRAWMNKISAEMGEASQIVN